MLNIAVCDDSRTDVEMLESAFGVAEACYRLWRNVSSVYI